MIINASRTMLLLMFFLIGTDVAAQTIPSRPKSFDQLPAQEQNLLKAAAALWPQLDGNAQTQLRAQAKHWQTLSPAAQQTLLLKQRQWDSASFAEKSKERSRFAAWQSLGKVDQVKVNAAYEQWRLLPIEKQQALRAKFAQQLPEYQQAWVLGPSLGKEAQSLQDWLQFIPQEQIRPWLMVLREFRAEDRIALVKLGKRWNPQQRDTFRTRLLSAPAGARADMIQHEEIK